MERGAARKGDIAALWFVTAAVTLFYADAIFTSKVFLQHDHLYSYGPYMRVVVGMLKQGILPLWNPHVAFGQPLHAVLVQLFYPTTFLYYVLPFDTAFKAHLLVHVYLGAYGMYFLARRCGLSCVASALASVMYGLGSFMSSEVHFYNSIVSAGWSPWIIAALLACARAPRPWRIALAALVLALGLAGGEAETLFFAVGVTAILGLASVGAQAGWLGRAGRVAATYAVVGVLGTALAAYQVLPTWELLRDAPRGTGLTEGERNQFSLTPLTTLEMLSPRVLGDPEQVFTYLGAMSWGGRKTELMPYFHSMYVGVAALVLMACGMLLRRGWMPKVLGAFVLTAFLAMFGGPVWHLLSLLPGLHSFRFPVKFFTFVSLGGSLLAAMALDALRERAWCDLPRFDRWVWRIALAGVGLFLLADGLTWLLEHGYPEELVEALQRTGDLRPILLEAVRAGYLGSLREAFESLRDTVFLQLALAMIAAWLLAGRRWREASTWVFVVLLTLDLGRANAAINRLASPELVDARPALLSALPPNAPDGRVITRVPTAEYPPPAGFSYFRPGEPSEILPYYLFKLHGFYPVCGMRWGLSYGNLYDQGSVYPAILRELQMELRRRASESTRINCALRTGVRYIVSLAPIEDPGVRLLTPAPNPSTHPYLLYEIRGALPRAILVPSARRISEAGARKERWLSSEFDPLREVVLEGSALAETAQAPMVQQVRWEKDSPLEVDLRVSAERAGWLVLLDSWSPGWEAEVDGASVPIERADVLFRAVPVPAGEHRVRFHYDPWSFRVGVRVSLGAAALCLLLAAASLLRRA